VRMCVGMIRIASCVCVRMCVGMHDMYCGILIYCIILNELIKSWPLSNGELSSACVAVCCSVCCSVLGSVTGANLSNYGHFPTGHFPQVSIVCVWAQTFSMCVSAQTYPTIDSNLDFFLPLVFSYICI